MKSVEERAKYDDYKIEDEYDFSNGIRGKFYNKNAKFKLLPYMISVGLVTPTIYKNSQESNNILLITVMRGY